MSSRAGTQELAQQSQDRFLRQIAPDSQFHRLFDHVEGLHLFAKDRRGRIMFVSRDSLARHGVKHEWEIVGKTDADIVPRHLAEAYVADDAWIYRTGTPLVNRVELWLNPQRVPDWYITNKLPIRSRSGDIIGVMGILQSYEGRKRHLEPYIAIAAAVDFIGQNFHLSLRVAELARRCHLSVRHMERKFLEAFRMTPQEFIIHTRVQFACEALLNSRKNISQVAQETGFNDQSAFTRQFRRHMGMTPGQYRRRVGGPVQPDDGR